MAGYQIDRAHADVEAYPALHGGDGTVAVKFFRFGGAARPAHLLQYVLPPGASEGMHRHGEHEPGEAFVDEFYYVVSGSGELTVDDAVLALSPGDHVHVPPPAARGVRNTGGEPLVINLTVVERERGAG